MDKVCDLTILMGLMGKPINGCDFDNMLPIWHISWTYISQMYYRVIRQH